MFYRRLFNKILIAFFLSLTVGWILYVVWGHDLIETVYKGGDNPLLRGFMAGRSVTHLEDYYYAADMKMLNITGWSLLVGFILAALVNSPAGTLISTVSFLITSFIIFTFFEFFPSLIGPFHLDIFPYFAHRSTYLGDPVLAYTEKPHNPQVTHVFRGHAYSPVYGIDVAPATMEWRTDGEGFRNDRTLASADVVVMGDSFIEYGLTAADTFGKRLEAKVAGLKVANLGKSGDNPFQYLEVFKRFGIPKKPKYALFCFYEGNDISEMAAFMQWQRGKGDYNLAYTLDSKTFFQRYRIAAEGVIKQVQGLAMTQAQVALQRLLHTGRFIHPEVAVLRLPSGESYKMLFVPRLGSDSPKEMLRSEEWIALKKILMDFKVVSFQHSIVPIVVYIPTVTHIYAKYSSEQSGRNWLRDVKDQIAAATNTETAMSKVAHDVSIQFISLSPAFEETAQAGKLLYYTMDSHWNSDGRELAAQVVAKELSSTSFRAIWASVPPSIH